MLAPDDIVSLLVTTVTFPDFHPLAGRTGPVHAFLIRHTHGPVLVDTGVGAGNAFIDDAYRPVDHSLVGTLGSVGVQVSDVVAVINTHLHFDHAGRNALFRGAPIHVQAEEWRLVEAGGHTVDEWVRFDGAEYHHVSGEAGILPGVRVLPTRGHTDGHQAVVIDTFAGPVVIAGQVPYDAGELEHVAGTGELPEPNGGDDTGAYLASVQAILAIGPVQVLFSHAEPWQAPRA